MSKKMRTFADESMMLYTKALCSRYAQLSIVRYNYAF